MLSTAYYFLQVFFCSAVLMGYYWLVLRDKKFHQYNRFYLISVLLMSWIIPLIKIQWTKPVTTDAQVINFLSIVADNNAEIDGREVIDLHVVNRHHHDPLAGRGDSDDFYAVRGVAFIFLGAE